MNATLTVEKSLAIHGGPKTRTTPLPNRHLIGAEEKNAVMRLFDQAIAQGNQVLGYNGPEEEAYCRDFAQMLGGGYADGVNSGSSALYVALRALELEPYAEVIVPAISDPGGVMPVALCNLIPVPADCAPDSYNTSAEQIRQRLTPRTRAIIVAHIAGIPLDMDPILELARSRHLPVIEDCAQAPGALYKGKPLGSMGDSAAFSTMFGKHFCTGGQGGLVFTRNEQMYWRIRRYADRGKPFGVTSQPNAAANVGAAASAGENVVAAINCNMDELHACIGREQLKKLPSIVRRRRELAGQMAAGCNGLQGVKMVGDPANGQSSYWFVFFRFDAGYYCVDKRKFVEALIAEGLPFGESYLHVPTHQPWCRQHRAFGNTTGLPWSAAEAVVDLPALPNTYAADASHFRLMFHEDWTTQEANDTIAALKKVDQVFRI